MQANISALAGQRNPAVYCYCDSVEVWFPPILSDEGYRAIRRVGMIWYGRHRNRFCGYRLIVNQPSKVALLDLDAVVKKYRGFLSRVDIALDIQPNSPGDRATLLGLILQSAVLRWRRKGPMREEEQGTYWVKFREGTRRPARNLVLYHGRPNKITGEENAVHLELRFYRPDSIRRQGIHSVRNLISLNPSDLFYRNLKWSDAGEEYVNHVTRKTVKVERERFLQRKEPTTHEILLDKLRNSIPRFVRSILNRAAYYDRAQVVKDKLPHRKVKAIAPPFLIPTELTWLRPPTEIIEDFRNVRGVIVSEH